MEGREGEMDGGRERESDKCLCDTTPTHSPV